MKNRFFFSMLLVFSSVVLISAQDAARVNSEKSLTWYGIDYALAKFTLVVEDPAIIVNQYMKAINTLTITETEKYNFKTFFNKSEVSNDLDPVKARNAAIDPANLVIADAHEITLDHVKKEIRDLQTKGEGLGVVFVAENLNKSTQTGSYWVCFFDKSTHEIVDAKRMIGKAAGIGFRNYWAGSVYNILKTWVK
jgi:hypothetical protein